MALTEEQREYIREANALGPDENGHWPGPLEIMWAGQFEGVDFSSIEEVEAFLKELRNPRGG